MMLNVLYNYVLCKIEQKLFYLFPESLEVLASMLK